MIVHILQEGRAICGLPGLPVDWPEGNVWIAFDDPDAARATCTDCVAARDRQDRRDSRRDWPAVYTKATEGKYDNETSAVLEITQAEAVLVVVKQGHQGDGFSVAVDLRKVSAQKIMEDIPRVLRDVADNIERQERKKKAGLQ